MNLRKRAISGIMLAGSMVVMCAIADAASTVSAEAVSVVADTRTDLATAGVVAQLNQVSTDAVEMAAAGVENSQTILVASADEEAQVAEDTEEASAVQEETVSVEKSAQADSKEDETTQEADAVEDVQNADVDSETDTENTVDVENTKDIENTKETENIEDTENIQNTENAEWQNRLMADVDEFLYVRASGDADAEIIGKLYKGDVADVVENGDTWTHVVSGDVDGYVNNDYCVSG